MTLGEQLQNAQSGADRSFSNRAPSETVAPCPLAKTHWIEIHLVDDAGHPMAQEAYVVYPPGGDPISGTLDENGHARHEQLQAGPCKVVFPSRERTWWEPNPPVSPPAAAAMPPTVTATLPWIPDHWIELHLADDSGQPVPFEPYEIQFSASYVVSDYLDENGFARVEGLPGGRPKVIFPRRESAWWRPDEPPPPPPIPARLAPVVAVLPGVPDSWIEICLTDDTGAPVAFEPFEIRYSNGSREEGVLDERGFARVEGLMKGKYQVVFPSREEAWWKPDTSPPAPAAVKPLEVLEMSLPATEEFATGLEPEYEGQ